MKRTAATVIFLSALAALGACTSTTGGQDDAGCQRDDDCATGDRCDQPSGECRAATDDGHDSCEAPTDCEAGYTCGKNSRCLPGDCYFNGCVAGFGCQSSTGTWECLPNSAGAAGASGRDGTTEAGAAGVADAGSGG